jgi:hypothetical protein
VVLLTAGGSSTEDHLQGEIYVGVDSPEALAWSGVTVPRDPCVDPILPAIYGGGLSVTDPALLNTPAEVRPQ